MKNDRIASWLPPLVAAALLLCACESSPSGMPLDLAADLSSSASDMLKRVAKPPGEFALTSDLTSLGTRSCYPQPEAIVVADFNRDGEADLAIGNECNDGGPVSVLLGDGTGHFAAVRSFAVGNQPQSIAVGEFNGDGVPDLVAANFADNTLSVLLGDGTGGFRSAGTVPVGASPSSVTVADWNGDGKADLAVANSAAHGVSLLFGTGTASFSAPTNLPTSLHPQVVLAGDWNGDGKADLAVGIMGGSVNDMSVNASVAVFPGDGKGGFGSPTSSAISGFQPTELVAGDWNGDGKPDVAVADPEDFSVSVLLGDGMGGFSSIKYLFPAAPPTILAAGDWNGDGKLDLAVTFKFALATYLGDGTGSFPSSKRLPFSAGAVAAADWNGDGELDLAVLDPQGANIRMMLGDGMGDFVPPGDVLPGPDPDAAVLGVDFNGDGHLDLAMLDVAGQSVSVGLGNGAGGFGPRVGFAVGKSPAGLVTSDFNGDGHADLAVADTGESGVSALLGDGHGGFAPAAPFVVCAAPGAPAVGDFNRDGKPDLAVTCSGDEVAVLLGDGHGGFAPPIDFAVGMMPSSVAVGDLNHDGKADLVVAIDGTGSAVAVLLGDGNGGFAPAIKYPAPDILGIPASLHFVALGDFNGDGLLDVVATSDGDYIVVFLGDGLGGLGPDTALDVGGQAGTLAVADWNGDGFDDIAVAIPGDNSVNVLLGDGAGSFNADLAQVYGTLFDTGLGPVAVAAGDWNGDGKLDVAAANQGLGGDNVNDVSLLLNVSH